MWNILVVDDDSSLRSIVSASLPRDSYYVEQASDGDEAVNRIRATKFHLVLLDVQMPKLNGLDALKEIKAYDPSIIVIMLTAFSNVRDAVAATKAGAFNYLEKPVKAENLVYVLDAAIKAHHMVRDLSMAAPVVHLAGGSEAITQDSSVAQIFSLVDRLSQLDMPVLVKGESGTGKEWIARALHYHGPRKDNRFVSVNCSAIPANLMESEFFGHEKGAFTGADSRKIGKFQYADGGTLFLDEVGDLPLDLQTKLLRAIQEKRFTPVGSLRDIETQVRIVSATNKDLDDLVRKGLFREDLLYRINVIPIELPPLRARKGDIQSLAAHFLDRYRVKYRKQITRIHPDAFGCIQNYPWPGNIRELENAIERAVVLTSSTEIRSQDLPETVRTFESTVEANVEASSSTPDRLDFQANKEAFERQFLIRALQEFQGRINQTALHANIPKKTLLRKLEKYGINARDFSKE